MKYLIDTHTHTIASGHAYNTIDEMTKQASQLGLQGIAITDHAPKMPGSAHKLYFSNLKTVYREKYGIHRYMGSEVNILNSEGKLDLSEGLLRQMDVVIASLHIPCIAPSTIDENTRAVCMALANPYVHILGHPDDGRYPLDMEEVVKCAWKYNKLLELNNTSLNPDGPRQDAYENDLKMLNLCKKYKVHIALGSDAHVEEDIARFDRVQRVLEAADFPEGLVVNTDIDLFNSYISQKK